MDEETLKEKFKQLNPYKTPVISDPFTNEIIDVESINKKAFDHIIEELKFVKKSGESKILVLQGEPGSGKSHLLARVYRNAEKERFLFALYNPLIIRIESTYHSLLKSLFDSLERKHTTLMTKPINHLRGEIIRIGLSGYKGKEDPKTNLIINEICNPKKEKLPYVNYENFESLPNATKARLRKVISENALEFVKKNSGSALGKKYLLAIFEALIDTNTYDTLLELVNEGGLSKEDSAKLRLSSGFSINEDVAQEILRSIFVLSPFPILLSIDQIEHLDRRLGEEGIKQFLEDTVSLVEHSKKLLLLLSAQTAIFRKWMTILPVHIKDRLSNTATLEPMTTEQGLEIIKARNAYYFKKLNETPKDPYFPFNKEILLEEIKKHRMRSPRNIIKLADDILEGKIIEEVPTTSIEETYENILKKQIYKKEETEDSLGELLLTLFDGKNLYPHSKKIVIKLDDYFIGIDNSKANYYPSVKKLTLNLNRKNNTKGVLIRDEKLPIREGTKSSKLIDKYKITIRYFTKDEGKSILALQKLISYTESGDLELPLEEVKIFAKEKVEAFLERKTIELTKKNIEERNSSTAQLKQNERAEDIVNKIVKELDRFRILRISHFIDLNANREIINDVITILQSRENIKVIERNGDFFIAKEDL